MTAFKICVALAAFAPIALGATRLGKRVWIRFFGPMSRNEETLFLLFACAGGCLMAMLAAAIAGSGEGISGLEAGGMFLVLSAYVPAYMLWRWRVHSKGTSEPQGPRDLEWAEGSRRAASIYVAIGAGTLAVGLEALVLALLF